VLDADMCIEVSEYAVVVQQRVVDVEQEYDIVRLPFLLPANR
jgi:hypothetical protein